MQCDVCECWVHQICGLFNKGRNKEETPYVCPMCLLDGAPRSLPRRRAGCHAFCPGTLLVRQILAIFRDRRPLCHWAACLCNAIRHAHAGVLSTSD